MLPISSFLPSLSLPKDRNVPLQTYAQSLELVAKILIISATLLFIYEVLHDSALLQTQRPFVIDRDSDDVGSLSTGISKFFPTGMYFEDDDDDDDEDGIDNVPVSKVFVMSSTLSTGFDKAIEWATWADRKWTPNCIASLFRCCDEVDDDECNACCFILSPLYLIFLLLYGISLIVEYVFLSIWRAAYVSSMNVGILNCILGITSLFLPLRMMGVYADPVIDGIRIGSPINHTLYPCECVCAGTFDPGSFLAAFVGCGAIAGQCLSFLVRWISEPQLHAGQSLYSIENKMVPFILHAASDVYGADLADLPAAPACALETPEYVRVHQIGGDGKNLETKVQEACQHIRFPSGFRRSNIPTSFYFVHWFRFLLCYGFGFYILCIYPVALISVVPASRQGPVPWYKTSTAFWGCIMLIAVMPGLLCSYFLLFPCSGDLANNCDDRVNSVDAWIKDIYFPLDEHRASGNSGCSLGCIEINDGSESVEQGNESIIISTA